MDFPPRRAAARRVTRIQLYEHLTFGGKLDRIADQIHQDLAQARNIAKDFFRHRTVHLVREFEAFFSGLRGQQIEGILDALAQLQGMSLQLHFARLDFRNM